MRVIEQFILGKFDDPSLCEDVIVVTDDFAAVLDGATDKSGQRYAGITGGAFAARTVASAIEQLPSEIEAEEAVGLLSAQLATAIRDAAGTLPADLPSTQLVIYSHARHEIWQVGDCSYLDGDSVHLPAKAIDAVASQARRAMIESYLVTGEMALADLGEEDPGREFILPLLKRQYLFANLDSDSPFAFGVINGRTVPSRFIEVHPVASSEIVLASDGYPRPLPTLAVAEAALASALQADPLCIGELASTKGLAPGQLSFDDRAYLRLAL